MSASNAAAKPMEREITLSRIIDAPREAVWQAWTDPKHLQQWWGPNGFTNPVCKVDVKVGGTWHIVMRSPDGAEYPCGGVYREVVAPEKLVFTNNPFGKDGKPLMEGLTTVLLEDDNGKTKLTLTTRARALVDFAAAFLQGMDQGWAQSLDRLVSLAEKA